MVLSGTPASAIVGRSGNAAERFAVDTASDDSYFKFNLDYINLYNLIRLESSSAKSIHHPKS